MKVYTIIAMHIKRLGGFGGCEGTEEGIARVLESGKTVLLRENNNRTCVLASLQIEEVDSVADGRRRVEEIVEGAR